MAEFAAGYSSSTRARVLSVVCCKMPLRFCRWVEELSRRRGVDSSVRADEANDWFA
jgi:hypothetical protein